MAVLTGTRVLLIEDEAMIAMMLEDFLEQLGCVVVATASRLEDALVQAGGPGMDVAMLDINLAGELSYPVADLLRARGVPFVFVTGYGTAGLPERLRDAPVLGKPFVIGQLSGILMRAVAG
jgi:CheY-like chemotaxis protein